MSIRDLKFREADFDGQDISSLDDRPKLTAAELKARFDNIGKMMIGMGQFNALIDTLANGAALSDITVSLEGLPDRSLRELLAEYGAKLDDRYTKAAVDKALEWVLAEANTAAENAGTNAALATVKPCVAEAAASAEEARAEAENANADAANSAVSAEQSAEFAGKAAEAADKAIGAFADVQKQADRASEAATDAVNSAYAALASEEHAAASAVEAADNARLAVAEAGNAAAAVETAVEQAAKAKAHAEQTEKIAASAKNTEAAIERAVSDFGKWLLGLGTEDNPYRITNARELYLYLHNFPAAYSLMVSDVDLTNEFISDWEPVGSDVEPFTGCLDGGGHTISGLSCSKNINGADYTGFIAVNAGTIKNLRFAGAVIEGERVGVVAGKNTGVIENVAVADGTVTATLNGGGIASVNTGIILNSYNKADITAKNAAGITVSNELNGSITNVYSTGSVAVTSGVSGYKAGIAVTNTGSAAISAAFSLLPETMVYTELSNSNITSSAAVKPANLRDADFLKSQGWDFEDTWQGLLNNFPGLRVIRAVDEPVPERPDGSVDNPYIITDECGLANIRNELAAHYILGSNIALSRNFVPIGTPEEPFTGSLDGKYYQIENLKITSSVAGSDGNEYAGLFAFNSGTVRRLVLLLPKISVSDVNAYVGGIAGINNGTIEVTGIYTGELSSGYLAGGIAAVNNGTIENVYNLMQISGGTEIGGITARNEAAGTVDKVLNVGSLVKDYSGNLAYINNGTIIDSYALAGTALLKDTTGSGTMSDSAVKLASALKKQSTYKNWDFDNIWVINGSNYPTFKVNGIEEAVAMLDEQ